LNRLLSSTSARSTCRARCTDFNAEPWHLIVILMPGYRTPVLAAADLNTPCHPAPGGRTTRPPEPQLLRSVLRGCVQSADGTIIS
jgi:hypothetical protein